MGTGDMDVEGFLMVSLVGSTSKIPASVTCMLVLLPRRSPILGAIDLAIVIPLNTLIPYQLYYTESSGLTVTLVSRSVLIIHALSFRVTRKQHHAKNLHVDELFAKVLFWFKTHQTPLSLHPLCGFLVELEYTCS